MRLAPELAVGIVKYVDTPVVVMRPIELSPVSVNQIAPSGPAVMPSGKSAPAPIGNVLAVPAVVMRPTALADDSVNHNALSGPEVMSSGSYAQHASPNVVICGLGVVAVVGMR